MAKKFDIKVNAPTPAKGYDGILAPAPTATPTEAPAATPSGNDGRHMVVTDAEKKLTVTFSLPPTVVDRLSIYAALTRQKKNAVIAAALERVFDEYECAHPGTLATGV